MFAVDVSVAIVVFVFAKSASSLTVEEVTVVFVDIVVFLSVSLGVPDAFVGVDDDVNAVSDESSNFVRSQKLVFGK